MSKVLETGRQRKENDITDSEVAKNIRKYLEVQSVQVQPVVMLLHEDASDESG